ncbi:DUF11 domain-containing protein [Microbacterium sp. Leaf320]|uniref:DUF7927 domain-containing protein n=1 Tax=Microbacterium sp. Leaf320 TaxID=1736334 RepID=UPI0012F9839E|nr:DUF11 domain-containing protein [Microbacterium sp. Leaf320]
MRGSQTQYAYLADGDALSLSFTKQRIDTNGGSTTVYTALDAEGTTRWTCTVDATDPIGTACATPAPLTGAAGVWEIRVQDNSNTGQSRVSGYHWDHTVTHNGAPLAGRLWTNQYVIWQPGDAFVTDMSFWAVSDAGYKYTINMEQYMGVHSTLAVNAAGVTDPPNTCTSLYASFDADGTVNPNCTLFRLFWEEPAADLPESAPSPSGETKVVPPLLDLDGLAVPDLAFTSSSTVAGAGTFNYSITPYFLGNYWVEIDTNGNGSYTDSVDRRILQGADGSGTYSTAFDGLDGEGNPVDECGQMRARIYYDKVGEIHFVSRDVEWRGGGIEMIRQNGPGAPDDVIYWDDTQLDPNRPTTTPLVDGTAGVPSTGGVHGWARAAGPAPVSWGDARLMDDWAYVPITQGTGEIALDGRCLSLEKSTDGSANAVIGDTVTYTVSVTNNGAGDYTEADPAVVVDDMTAVLDDATFNDDAEASVGSVEFADNALTWTGRLAAGETATFTYSVTVTNVGDHRLTNTAAVTPGQCLSNSERCTSTTDTPLANVVPAKTSNPAPGATVKQGDEITYTLSYTNDGAAAGPVDSTDDLSAVLDDAEILVEPVSDTSGITATRTNDTLRVVGSLNPGATATVTYTVKVRDDGARGDSQLRNVVVPDVEPACSLTATCPERATEHKVTPTPPVTRSSLASTGLDLPPVVPVAAGILLAVGAAAFMVGRRKRRSRHSD